MARGVEDVDHAILVFKLQYGGAHRDAALFFQLHPVRGGGPLVFARGDAAGQVESAAIEQEFFGERGFAGIGVRDDRKRAAAEHLALQGGRRKGVGGNRHEAARRK